jgi:hypothetical protein
MSRHGRLRYVGLMKNASIQHHEASSITAPNILRYVTAIVAFCILLTGCHGKQQCKAGLRDEICGDYTLATINGNNLPYTPPHKGGAPQVTSGMFAINPDGTCTSKILFALPSGKSSSREVTATYKWDANRLKMQWRGAGQTIGTLEGDTFTMINEGVIFSYRRNPH